MRSFTLALLILVLALSSIFSFAQSSGLGVPKSVFPKEGFVPTATVAVAIAEAPCTGNSKFLLSGPLRPSFRAACGM
jgi:hypothetical protein